MAVLAVGAVGAIAGGAIASTGVVAGLTVATAAGIGWTVGTIAGQALFGPSMDGVDSFQEGPRIGDTSVKGGSYGQAIPRVWGIDRIAGGMIWSQPIREEVVTTVVEQEGSGGKGSKGGSGASTTTVSYLYYGTFAIQLCEGEANIKRVWMNSKLVRDPDNGRTELDQLMTVYPGTETQVADSTMEAYEGVGNVPAYRGTCYIVFDDLPLAESNNMIPNIEVEIITKIDAPPTHLVEQSYGSDSVYYSDGTDVYTVSSFVVSNGGGGTKEIDYTRTRYNIATGTQLAQDIITATSSVPNAVADQVYICPGSRYLFMAEALLPADIDAVDWGYSDLYTARIYTYDILDNAWESEYYAPRYYIESGAINYQTGDVAPGSVSQNELWYAYVRGSAVIVIKMPDTFSQSDLEWWYKTVPAIAGMSPQRLMVDRPNIYSEWQVGIPYLLVNGGSDAYLTRIDLTSGIVWTTLVPDLSVGASTNPGSLIRNNWLFAYSSSSTQVAHRAYHIDTSSGALTQEEGQELGPIKANGNWFVQYGEDYALSNNGEWLAFDWLYDSNLGDIVQEVCEDCGLSPSQIDTAILDYTLLGYTRGRPMPGRSVIEGLQRILAFDAVESGGVLTFVPQDDNAAAGPVATILADDLGAHPYGSEAQDEVRITRQQELEMPRELVVSFKDPAQNYDIGAARITNEQTLSRDVVAVELPAVMTGTTGKSIARKAMNQALYSRLSLAVTTQIRMLSIEPSDIITISADHGDYETRVTGLAYSPAGVLDIVGQLTNADIYGVDESMDDPTIPPGLAPIIESYAAQASLPILRIGDAQYEGHYAYAGSASFGEWAGASLYYQTQAGLWMVATYWSEARSATYGAVVTPAGSTLHPWSWDDENTLNVQLTDGTLASSTDAEVQAGANAVAMGVDGRWEIIGFVTAVLETDGTYTLSRLLRGRRGTDHYIGTGAAADTFILLDDVGVRRVNLEGGSTGLSLDYRLVPSSDRLINATSVSYVSDGTGLTPFAPVAIGGTRDVATAALTITWMPRSRVNIENFMGEDYDHGETEEQYHVECRVAGSSVLLRTIVVDTNEATYSLATYNADTGLSATAIPSLDIIIYQISSVVGRGYPGEATV